MTLSLNPEKLGPILKDTAEKFILPRYKMLKDHEISSKTNPTDLVTLADIEAEQYLEKILPDLLTGSVVIGEEGVSRDESIIDVLSDKSQTVWVVDPVDGTYNFVHGGTDFGVMVALIHNGEAVGGWIYDVLNDNLTFTMKGEGVHDGGKEIRFDKDQPDLRADELELYLSPKFFPAKIRDDIKAKRSAFKNAAPKGCSAHEYLNVLRGTRQACVYCRLKPWDHLPGTLMLTEAGGFVQQWDYTPYLPQETYGGLIATTSERYWQTIYDTLFEDIDLSALKKKKA